MHRTQIYLTDDQIREIKVLSSRLGVKQSELIRKALDEFLDEQFSQDWKADMRAAAGIWAGREDLPDFSRLRAELDR